MKRIFDLLLSSLGILVSLPLLISISGILLCLQGRPVFFLQERVGQYSKRFWIWKFRTMATDAEKTGGALTASKDQRVTRCGYWLRKFKLDELPQLWNVLKGEMSLVGPRPEVPYYVEKYNEEQRQVLKLKPGITDVATICYRNESEQLSILENMESTYVNTIMPEKIRTNLAYAKRANVAQDTLVILKTLRCIIT